MSKSILDSIVKKVDFSQGLTIVRNALANWMDAKGLIEPMREMVVHCMLYGGGLSTNDPTPVTMAAHPDTLGEAWEVRFGTTHRKKLVPPSERMFLSVIFQQKPIPFDDTPESRAVTEEAHVRDRYAIQALRDYLKEIHPHSFESTEKIQGFAYWAVHFLQLNGYDLKYAGALVNTEEVSISNAPETYLFVFDKPSEKYRTVLVRWQQKVHETDLAFLLNKD